MVKRIVIKVGGATLFQNGGFQSELRSLIAKFEADQVWMLAGGGDLVESMRTAHRIYPKLDAVQIHWRCIELLDHTWQLANEIFLADSPITTFEDLKRVASIHNRSGVHWVRVQSFYNRAECHDIPDAWCPESSWNTTTDALAWLLAKRIDADRVILMKQCECDPNWSLTEASQRGIIDSELARLVSINGAARPSVEFSSKYNCRISRLSSALPSLRSTLPEGG